MKRPVLAILLAIVLLVAGCGKSGTSSPSIRQSAAPTPKDPITLKIANDSSSLNDTGPFDRRFSVGC